MSEGQGGEGKQMGWQDFLAGAPDQLVLCSFRRWAEGYGGAGGVEGGCLCALSWVMRAERRLVSFER